MVDHLEENSQTIPIAFVTGYDNLMDECERYIFNRTAAASISRDTLVLRLESMLHIIEEGLHYLTSVTFFPEECSQLSGMHQNVSRHLRLVMYGFNDCTVPPVSIVDYRLIYSGRAGRPKKYINIDIVDLLRSCGYRWHEVADAMQVGRTTLWRRLTEEGYRLSRFTDISDHELDFKISSIITANPNYGLQLISGGLRSSGVYVPRSRIRESVNRIDPLRRIVRWHQVISRRTYNVKRANSLWHIDGHHSLIRWKIVVHGGIDGYSRLVVYLHCSTNNRSLTVYRLFLKAIETFGIPSRVRSDKGGENVLVCHFMISTRGTGRGSHIAGSSVHNQRIERLWRDVFRCVCSTYYQLFYSLEAEGVLDPTNDCDLFVLHHVFVPRINKSLTEFSRAWNAHPLRTERNWTPQQIMANSLIREGDMQDVIVSDDFGVDTEGPIPNDDEDSVEIPQVLSPLDGNSLEDFLQFVDNDSNFDDFGYQHFIDCKLLLQNLIDDDV